MLAADRVLIYTGGRLGRWALEQRNADDLIIGADSGALFLIDHGLKPHLSIGDFDSVTAGELDLIRAESWETLACDPIDKDYTDTELAFRHALDIGAREIVLLGALGSRFDHSLANVHLLMLALEQGAAASIVDENNRIRLCSSSLSLVREPDRPYENVSLLPLTASVQGVTLEGFMYPLHEAELRIGQSLGISNVMKDDVATISVRDGILLVIESRD
ncbi:thiamine diphosphokinase [Paenibacillus sp. GCM10023252]|uniref:thiamine diphosphokinase n=1 Tax=Paenibacillus sp. GCM10023252 TaxID=3252649 RepID=UPI0036241E67